MSIATFSLVAGIVSGLLAAAAALILVRLRSAHRGGAARSGDDGSGDGAWGGGGPGGGGSGGGAAVVVAPARPRRITLVDLLAGVVVGGAAFVVSLVVGELTLGLTAFGAMSVTYLLVVVGVPLGMAVVLVAAGWARWRDGGAASGRAITRPALTVCAASLLLAPIGFYATHIEPGMLDVERPPALPVASTRAGTRPVTIGVLTDLQTGSIGERERAVAAELMAARPDVIVLPGDFIQEDDAAFARHVPALRDLLGSLSAPGGVFLVGGDVDQPLDRLPSMVEGTGVRYLADEVARTTVGDRELTIGGIGLAYDSAAARAVVDQLETEPGDGDIRILLAHRPDPVLALAEGSRIDLQVSGHTHGGQIAVPFVGPLMTLTGVPRHVAAGGLHEVDGHPIYVGRGVGLERGQAPQVRFGVRPNIGVVTIGT